MKKIEVTKKNPCPLCKRIKDCTFQYTGTNNFISCSSINGPNENLASPILNQNMLKCNYHLSEYKKELLRSGVINE